MKHESLTAELIAVCMKVHSAMGPGLLESVYEKAVSIELKKRGIAHMRQLGIHTTYEDEDLGVGLRADIIVDNKVLLELKSAEAISPLHIKTTLTYLKFAKIEVGLIINFNVISLRSAIKRLINDTTK
jgi:GxxExxY protein